MTVLYRLDADAGAIANTFGVPAGGDLWAGGHIAPESFAPVVTAAREFIAGPRMGRLNPRITPRIWGVPPPPASGDPTRGITSVRNAGSPFWIGNLRNSEFRCLVPATAFMEWGKGTDHQGRRRKRWFAPSDQGLFAFAGVWKDSEVPSFSVLTCEANALLRQHGCDRMPVLLPPTKAAQGTWLHGGWKQAESLLQPYASSLMREVKTPRASQPVQAS